MGSTNSPPRRFVLDRAHDVSGVSGTGVVADGVQWPDGSVAMRWRGDRASTVIHESVEAIQAVHGHGGRTTIRWVDPLPDPHQDHGSTPDSRGDRAGRVGKGWGGGGSGGATPPGGAPVPTYRLPLPYDSPPLTLNKRMHWAQAAAWTRQIRKDTGYLIRAKTPARDRSQWPVDRIRVQLVWRPVLDRRRDTDNPSTTLKAVVDGLVDAGIVRDDTSEHVERPEPIIQRVPKDHPGPRLEVVVSVLGAKS